MQTMNSFGRLGLKHGLKTSGSCYPHHRSESGSRWCVTYFRRSAVTNSHQSSHQYSKNGNENRNHNKHEKPHWKQAAVPLISIGLAFGGYAYVKLKRQPTICAAKVIEENVKKDSKEFVESKAGDDLEAAIKQCRTLCYELKDKTGAPGFSVSVTVDGQPTWSHGFGDADLENKTLCEPYSVMRIASISKSIAMTIVAKLMEEGKLDIDKPIQTYVPSWPEKTFQGQKVSITTRQLVSHLSGVRHYDKNCGRKDTSKNSADSNKVSAKPPTKEDSKKSDDNEKEFHTKRQYNNVTESLDIFKNDDLCSKPGTEYLYTTHGWTLVSAVAEGAAKTKFPALCRQLFRDLGLEDTYLDEQSPLIDNRARQYVRNKNGQIINAPYVDNSCKWAGGGMISTTNDLVKFGNIMLYSYQHRPGDQKTTPNLPPGYLKAETMETIWAPVSKTKCAWDSDGNYGMGWGVVGPGGQRYGQCKEVRQYYSHTGGAVGGSSVLIVLPRKSSHGGNGAPPWGVVVAMIANTNAMGLSKTAMKIAKTFESLSSE